MFAIRPTLSSIALLHNYLCFNSSFKISYAKERNAFFRKSSKDRNKSEQLLEEMSLQTTSTPV